MIHFNQLGYTIGLLGTLGNHCTVCDGNITSNRIGNICKQKGRS